MNITIGDRVRAIHFGHSDYIDDNTTVPPGTHGTVTYIDGAGTIHVHWDNGATLGLLPDHDQWGKA